MAFPSPREACWSVVRAQDAGATHPTMVRVLVEGFSWLLAVAVGAALNVGGWMVLFSGAWRIGLWIVLLSTGIVSVVLWDAGGRRD